MGLLTRLLNRSRWRTIRQPPSEGSTTLPDYRPEGWKFPPTKGPEDSDNILPRGETDETHPIVRPPQHTIGPEGRG